MLSNIIDQVNDNKDKISFTEDNKIFGFWIYLMSDCVLFATFFAVYLVLKFNTAHGPTGKDIFNLSAVLIETFILLNSSITYAMAILNCTHYENKNKVIMWLSLTFIFGVSFIGMEIHEFYDLIINGYGPSRSAFLSSFFLLVGTHGVHVISGLIWILVMILHVFFYDITYDNKVNLQCLGLFWHFLDIIWICVFSVVYLLGVF